MYAECLVMYRSGFKKVTEITLLDDVAMICAQNVPTNRTLWNCLQCQLKMVQKYKVHKIQAVEGNRAFFFDVKCNMI